MNDCVFCKVVAGDFSAKKVYEDDLVLAFLDIHPLRPGHILVIPKKHEPDLHHLDNVTYTAVLLTAKRAAQKIEDSFHPKRVGFMVAGWDVSHAHVHVVPMEDYHDLTSSIILEDKRGNPSPEELAAIRDTLSFG